MQNIYRTFSFFNYFFFATACLMKTEKAHAKDQEDPVVFAQSNRWVSSIINDNKNIIQITIHNGEKIKFITEGHRDISPCGLKKGI